MIAAILKAQLLTLRTMGRKRSVASTLSILPALIYYGLWTLWSVIFGAVIHSVDDRSELQNILGIALAGVFLYWQIAPIITASMGPSLELQKLIVYPIQLDRLFLVEVGLRLLTVGEMLLLIGGMGFGLALNPHFGGAATIMRLLFALPLFILFNLLMAAGLRSLIERVFRNKRTRTFGMLAFVLIAITPSLLMGLQVKWDTARPYLPLGEAWPWGAAATFATHSSFWPVPTLVVWIAAAYVFGRWQFYRALNADPYAGRTSPGPGARQGRSFDALFRWPSSVWADPLGALVEKELRGLARSVGFRVSFIMGFTFGLLVFLPQALNKAGRSTFIREHYFTWVSIYSLLLVGFYTFWNSFGLDRGTVQFYFAAPVPLRKVFFAKNIAAIAVQAAEVAMIGAVLLFFPVRLGWLEAIEAFSVTVVACLYLFGLGNLNSIRFPSPIDPDKTGRGASRSKSALTMLLFPFGLLPLVLAYWGGHILHSSAVFFGLLVLAALIGIIFYWIALDSAVDMAFKRREELISDLAMGEGPLAAQ